MNIFKKYSIGAIMLLGLFSNAQQLPQFTQYMYNTISVNPAYAGSREALNVTALHRNQWSGLEGNPRTTTISVHSPLKNEKIGIGLSYIRDELGDESSNYIYGDFAYSLQLSSELKMSFGLKAGFTNYNLEDPDPMDMATSSTSQWNPNIGAGFYIGTNLWYAGISAPRILNTDLNAGEFQNLERNSYYVIGGLVFDLSENTKFKPTALTKFTNGAPMTYDLTASFLFYEKFWLGASFRFNDASNFGAMADYQISKDLRIGYAYDIPTTKLSSYTGGTHEVILIYEFKKPSKGPVKSPRYF